MTIDDIILKTTKARLSQVDVEACCQQEQISPEAFCDEFARRVAAGYSSQSFSFADAASAMNGLWFGFQFQGPKFAESVFRCFDAGECHPKTPHLSSDEVSRPLVERLLGIGVLIMLLTTATDTGVCKERKS
jgi:hypothetical protein